MEIQPSSGDDPNAEQEVDFSHQHDQNAEQDDEFEPDDFFDLLESIESSGTFAAFGKINDLPHIVINGYGGIGVPLPPQQALEIISRARQAPFGRGTETIVDTSVRNTWELDPTQYQILNPDWESTVLSACDFVKEQLGITVPIMAKPYKMLIYEEGALFKPHTDSEKIAGMFGTLVFCLPSAHQGGDLVLKHGGETKVFKTSETQPAIACWYSDVHHEVLPVTSGYRWVLTYNLAISPTLERPSASANSVDVAHIRHSLTQWLNPTDGTRPQEMYYLLSHDYTEANISYRALKGADQAKVRALVEAADGLDMQIFLAVIEMNETGDAGEATPPRRGGYGGYGFYDDDGDDGLDWHELDDIYDTHHFINAIVDLDGRTLGSKLEVEREDLTKYLLQDDVDPFEDSTKWETNYTGFTGNEGTSATHWYRTAIVMLVPNDEVNDLLHRYITRDQAQGLIVNYLPKCADPRTRSSALSTLAELCKKAWLKPKGSKSWESTKVDFDVVHQLLKFALDELQYDLFQSVLGYHESTVGGSVFKSVRSALVESGLDFKQVAESLHRHLLHFPVSERIRRATLLAPKEGQQMNPDVKDWITNQVGPSCLAYCTDDNDIGYDDGSALVDLAQQFHDFDYLETNLIPVVVGKFINTPFTLGFLTRLLFRFPTAVPCFEDLATRAIMSLDLTPLFSQPAAPVLYYQAPKPSNIRSTTLTHTHLLQFLTLSASHSPTTVLPPFLTALTTRLSTTAPSPARIPTVWLPLLRALPTTPLFHPLIQAVSATLHAYLTPEPPTAPPGSFKHPTTGCWCQRCGPLNAFLASDAREIRIPGNIPARKHLHQMIERIPGNTCSHRGVFDSLHVVKGLPEAAKKRREWERRKTEVLEGLAGVDLGVLGEGLKGVLGLGGGGEEGGDAAAVVATEVVVRGGGAVRAGMKRRREEIDGVEVIDLTSD